MAVYYGAFCLVWFGFLVYSAISAIHEFSAMLIGGAVALTLIGLVPVIVIAYFVAYEAALRDDEICEFRSLLRRRSIRVQQIKSISSDEEPLHSSRSRQGPLGRNS